jgi:hypothetical protein
LPNDLLGAKKFAAECREQHAGSVRSPDKDPAGNRESASRKESKRRSNIFGND